MTRAARTRRIAWTLVVLASLSAACRQTLSMPSAMRVRAPEPGQMDLRRDYWDRGPNPQHPRSEIEGLAQRGGTFVKHGRERSFFRDGQVEAERHWIHGEPAGAWRTWWEDGTLKSSCEFRRDGKASEMSFWHANGQLEARGMAIDGRRIGPWEFFFADGTKESSGDFLDGKREGPWTSWNECGEVLDSARYEQGVKVGPGTQL